MRLSLRHKKISALALLNLLLGLINYLLFQPHIFLFRFTGILTAQLCFIQNTRLRHFITGYFSDIAWCCALYLVTAVLSELKQLHFYDKLLILLLPFIIEALQYFHVIPGTFDWYDLLTYGLILIVFVIFFFTKIHQS